jgi:hypothetical protein
MPCRNPVPCPSWPEGSHVVARSWTLGTGLHAINHSMPQIRRQPHLRRPQSPRTPELLLAGQTYVWTLPAPALLHLTRKLLSKALPVAVVAVYCVWNQHCVPAFLPWSARWPAREVVHEIAQLKPPRPSASVGRCRSAHSAPPLVHGNSSTRKYLPYPG